MAKQKEDRENLFQRLRAARTYAQTATNATKQEELELSAFMAIFHPEVPDDKVRDMRMDIRKKHGRDA